MTKPTETVEIRPGVFEELSPQNIKERGQNAGFFHSLGRALGGEEVDNCYLKANINRDIRKPDEN